MGLLAVQLLKWRWLKCNLFARCQLRGEKCKKTGKYRRRKEWSWSRWLDWNVFWQHSLALCQRTSRQSGICDMRILNISLLLLPIVSPLFNTTSCRYFSLRRVYCVVVISFKTRIFWLSYKFFPRTQKDWTIWRSVVAATAARLPANRHSCVASTIVTLPSYYLTRLFVPDF